MRIPFISLAAAGALALGGCAYGGYGVGLGYGGGYGSGYYGDYGYGPYGYGYGSPYYGWYDDFYYPGAGVYVYDSYRRPHMWNDRQRSYWSSRQRTVRSGTTTTTATTTTAPRENWSGFKNRGRNRTR
jgi:hypothetical protein